MKLRKVGGLYFWNIGRLGGSFYIKQSENKQANADWFGLGMCFALAISFVIY
jgi:hypothetical protein